MYLKISKAAYIYLFLAIMAHFHLIVICAQEAKEENFGVTLALQSINQFMINHCPDCGNLGTHERDTIKNSSKQFFVHISEEISTFITLHIHNTSLRAAALDRNPQKQQIQWVTVWAAREPGNFCLI